LSEEQDIERTIVLLNAVKAGDKQAESRLLKRYLPVMRRWAHGRLPAYARDLADTDDLVQVCLIRALKHIEGFECRGEGAFLAYLRKILLNTVWDHVRRVKRRPQHLDYDDQIGDPALVVAAVGVETLLAYEQALESLPEETRHAVMLRVEFRYTYSEVAEAIGAPSPNAARMMIVRGLAKIAKVMSDD